MSSSAGTATTTCCNTGNDAPWGGQGSDWLIGGTGKDFFSYQANDVSSLWQDTIIHFNGLEGDRLGINAVLDGPDPFANKGWNYIGSNPFSEAAAELQFAGGDLLGDVDGDGKSDLRIHLLGVSTFNPEWIS